MAELNEQYNQFIGARPSPSNPTVTEYFNKETEAGFSTPEQLFGFASTVSQKPIGSWADLAQPFRVEAPKEIPATALESPKSRFDLDQLLTENQKIRDQLLGSLAPSAEETSLQKRLFELQNEDRATELSAQAGISKAEDKVIPMEFITGQQDKIRRDANLALQTNAFRQQPILQNLQLLQQNRQSIREKLTAMAQFGQTDINLAMQLKQIATQEQQAAKEFALKFNVESPAYSVDGITVYNTQSGKPYSNEQDFFRDFGFKSWAEVPKDFIQRRFISDEERMADRNYLFEREQFDFSKYQFNQELGLKRYELEQQMAAIQGMGGLSKEQRTELNRVQDNIRQDKDVKDFIDVRDGYERVQTGAQLNNAQGDLALLFGYMKMLDPNSVVRETEFSNAESAMGYAQQVLNAPSKFFKGNRLTEEGRQFFAGAANKLYQTKEVQHNRAIDFYSNQLETFGIPRELGIRDFSTSFNNALVLTPLNGNDPRRFTNPLIGKYPYLEVAQFIGKYPDATESEIQELVGGSESTNPKGKTSYLEAIGTKQLFYGSPKWEAGLDAAGKPNTPIPVPKSGQVIAAGKEGGFGNRVKVKLQDGYTFAVGHLNKIAGITKGMKLAAGKIIGLMGNTGTVLTADGRKPTAKELAAGRGTHADITMWKPNGQLMTAKEVKAYLDKIKV